MNIFLQRRLNYKFITLSQDTAEVIGVYRKDGSVSYQYWGGFIDIEEAKRLGARPVKLEVECVGYSESSINIDWQKLGHKQYVAGCVVEGKVRAVIENEKIIIR